MIAHFSTPMPSRIVLVLLSAVLAAGCGREVGARDEPAVPLPDDWSRVPDEARSVIEEAARSCRDNPRSAAAFAHLGGVYQGNEMVALAAGSYEIALRLGSNEPRTHYLLGLIYKERGETLRAIEQLRLAASIEPSYAPAYFNLGESLLDAARLDEAIEAFREAVRLVPGEASFHAGLARSLRHAGALVDAEASLRRALELDPGNDEAHQLIGLTLRALGKTDAAMPHLERVDRRSSSVVRDPWLLDVQRHAATPEILFSRARAYIRQGRLASATELLDQATRAHPDRAVGFRLLGDARLRAGRLDEAQEAYSRAAALEPGDPEAHAALAVVLLQQGDPDGAARAAGLAIDADPDHAMARVVRASVELKRGRAEAAIETLRPVLERRDDLAAAHVVRGEALAELGRLDAAEAALARAVELEPRAGYPRRRLESLRQRRGNPGPRP